MSDPKPRPWWRKKTSWGIACSIAGGVLALAPGAPVVVVLGTVPVTTIMLAALLNGIGGALGAYGAARRADSAKQETQPDVPTPFKVVGKGGVK